jgi:hypothetical protein
MELKAVAILIGIAIGYIASEYVIRKESKREKELANIIIEEAQRKWQYAESLPEPERDIEKWRLINECAGEDHLIEITSKKKLLITGIKNIIIKRFTN